MLAGYFFVHVDADLIVGGLAEEEAANFESTAAEGGESIDDAQTEVADERVAKEDALAVEAGFAGQEGHPRMGSTWGARVVRNTRIRGVENSRISWVCCRFGRGAFDV